MSGRQIVASTLWQLLSQAAMALLSVITVKCVAVGLSLELAGYYNSAYGYLQIFGIIADFGLYAVAIREVSRAENKSRVLGALMVLRCSILLLSLGSALLIVWLLPVWRGTPLPVAVTIAALIPALTLTAGVLRSLFQVHHKMQYVFIAEVTQRVVTVILLGGAVLLGVRQSVDPQMLFLFLGIGSIGALTLFVLSFFFVSSIAVVRPVFDKKLLADLFWKSLPYGGAFLCMALYRQVDIALIAVLRPDFAVQNAIYGFTQRVMDMAYLFPTFLLNATLPHIGADRNAGSRTLLSKTFIGTLLLSGGCAVFAWFWARPLMGLLTTDAYLSVPGNPGADSVLQLLSISMLGNGLIVFSFYILLSVHAWRSLVGVLALGSVTSITLNLLLIPDYGFMGAGITSAISHTLMAVLLFGFAFRAYSFHFPWKGLLQWALWMLGCATFLFLLSPWLLSEIQTLLGIVVGGSFALLLAWKLGLLRMLVGQSS